MNLHQKYIEETGQQVQYLKWVEKIAKEFLDEINEPDNETGPEVHCEFDNEPEKLTAKEMERNIINNTPRN